MSLTTAGARVLVVDDHRDTLDVVGHILRGQGCRVDTADGCAGAEAMLEAGNYDVLLVDVVLPDGDGLDLVRRHPAIPAIAATACAFDQDRRASAEAGCLAHLSKPFTCQGLIDAVRLALTAQSPSAAPPPAPAPGPGPGVR